METGSVKLVGGPCSGQRFYPDPDGAVRAVYVDLRGAVPELKAALYQVVDDEGIAVHVEQKLDA